MKHQYVGDINDYRKYALLRALSADGANRIGVCWMLTPDDGGTHGGKTKWGDDMGRFDPPVSDFLQSINGHPERRNLWSIEQSGLLDAAEFAQMRRGAMVVNTSRGAILDADAGAGHGAAPSPAQVTQPPTVTSTVAETRNRRPSDISAMTMIS